MAYTKPTKKIPKKKKAKEKVTATKQDMVGFLGGLSVNLERKLSDEEGGGTLREKLRHDIGTLLNQELENQKERIEKIPVWNRMYRGQRDDRPVGQANVATPIPRILTEALVVRIFEGLYSQPKFWTASPVRVANASIEENELWEKIALELENDMDWWQRDIDLKKRLFDPILQSIKIGKGIVMMWPKSKKRTIVRRATDEEIADKDVPTMNSKDGVKVVKVVETESQQPDVFAISREDWVQSTDSVDIQKARLCGFRTYLWKSDIELRVRQGLYDSLEAKTLGGGDEIDETKKEFVESEKKVIDNTIRNRHGVWQLHCRYDVDGDGEEDDIMIWYHPQSKAILRCIYNPIFAGFRPFVDFVYNPSEYSSEGEGTCEILEKLVEEIDTMHNQRIDRISQINGPILFIRAGVHGLENFSVQPRQIYRIDENLEDIIQEFRFSDETMVTVQEEQHLIDLCMKAVGVTPDVLGQPTAERPVFREMASRQAEANKKFRFLNRLYRSKIEELGMMFLEMSAQYQPTHTYTVENGKMQEQRIINYPIEYLRDRIKVKLAGSSELENEMVKKEKAQEQYMILSQYYTQTTGMAQIIVNPNAPPDFKKWVFEVSKKTEKRMEKILRYMDVDNPEDAVMSLDDVMNEQQVLQTRPLGPPQMGPQDPEGSSTG